MATPQWEALKRNVIRYMEQTYQPPGSVEVLQQVPFELWEGTNGFNDEFGLLFLRADMATYIELEREDGTGEFRATRGYPDVADALQKLGHSIRFIAVEMDPNQDVSTVSVPNLTVTSDVVEAALNDAGTLIGTNGAARGVDRAHTAFHGYLESLCTSHGILFVADTSVTTLFSMLRQQLPSLCPPDPDTKRMIDQVLRGMSKIVDAIDSIRNKKSLAHPNPVLLDDPEAMLAINCIRTMLHYLNART